MIRHFLEIFYLLWLLPHQDLPNYCFYLCKFHETYKDKNNNWVSPDEVVTIEGKKFLKNDESQIIKVGASESMSKSKKNTIDPEEIIKDYGADSVRLFILSDSPPEKDVQWSDEGMNSSFKFIQKLWILNHKILNEINLKHALNLFR